MGHPYSKGEGEGSLGGNCIVAKKKVEIRGMGQVVDNITLSSILIFAWG